jgi:ATP-binding cassette subfamily B protein
MKQGPRVTSNRVGGLSSLRAMGRLLGLARPYARQFLIALAALFAGSGINLLFPEVVRRVLEPGVFSWVVQHLGVTTAVLAVLFILQGAAFYVRSYYFGLIGQRVFSELRSRLFAAISYREIPFFDGVRSGDLSARISSDAALVQDAVSVKFSVLIRYGVQVVLGVVLMAWMSWQLTIALVASVVLMVASSALFIASLRAASRRYQAAVAALTGFASECFSGAKIIRALAAQHDSLREFNRLNAQALEAAERRTFISASFSSGASLLLNLLLLLVQWYGISLVVSERLPLHDLAAFVLYGAIVAVSFAFLIGAYGELMQSVGGMERVFELLDAAPQDQSAEQRVGFAGIVPVDAEGPSISFENVSFSYPSRKEVMVLDSLGMILEGGKTTALVGPSGAGKSSIVQLLLAFYVPTSGRITVAGHALSELTEQQLRSSLAWVPQEPHLFGFTIYENLILGNVQLSREQVLTAISEWRFMDFVAELPNGIDTQLGEQGTQLSGGQRQRLAIARALLRRPQVLILDEATSGLDSAVEESVLQTIAEHLPKATVLLISHRLATVYRADKIVVLDGGRIVEEGSHAELAQSAGLYSQYVSRQALTPQAR